MMILVGGFKSSIFYNLPITNLQGYKHIFSFIIITKNE
uniref:Uncharacterized protein n=1 Tax=viral metagenome TaxID=1070528 RepID=A0A6C0JJS3_9ZZZZ